MSDLTADELECVAVARKNLERWPNSREAVLLGIVQRLTSASIADSGWRDIESAPKDGTRILLGTVATDPLAALTPSAQARRRVMRTMNPGECLADYPDRLKEFRLLIDETE